MDEFESLLRKTPTVDDLIEVNSALTGDGSQVDVPEWVYEAVKSNVYTREYLAALAVGDLEKIHITAMCNGLAIFMLGVECERRKFDVALRPFLLTEDVAP